MTTDDEPTRRRRQRTRRRLRQPPGLLVARRFRPRFHWELLVCGFSGHMIVGTGTNERPPAVDPLVIQEQHGMRWHRCLRCDSWLPIELLEEDAPLPPGAPEPAPLDRASIRLPLRGRPLRDLVVLRIIAIDRMLHFFVLALLAVLVLFFDSHRAEWQPTFDRVAEALQPGTSHGGAERDGLLHAIDEAFEAKSGFLKVIGGVLGLYAIIEAVEAVGLWQQKLWAEYLTLVATAAFIPVEIYEIVHAFTPLKIAALVLNVGIVVYLLFAKRLFGLRGGHAAIHAVYAEDVGWHALEAATPPLARG